MADKDRNEKIDPPGTEMTVPDDQKDPMGDTHVLAEDAKVLWPPEFGGKGQGSTKEEQGEFGGEGWFPDNRDQQAWL